VALLEMPELRDGKLSCVVLRGRKLPDISTNIRTQKKFMKTIFNILFISFFSLSTFSQDIIEYSKVNSDSIDFSKNMILKIEGDSSLGFNYPYFLYLPKKLEHKQSIRLMVEPNNTGSTNDFKQCLRKSLNIVTRNTPFIDSLGTPYLAPVFPRLKSHGKMYTHALDRDAMLVPKGDSIYRIDLQLLAMIYHAQELLSNNGFNIKPKIFLMGFSATGNFTNRFAALHPDKVRAVASGAVNGMPIIPLNKMGDDLLIYPVGIGDIDSLLGIKFNLSSYSNVSQFIYMGGLDQNDTYEGWECFDEEEKTLISKHLGHPMMPNRWNKSQEIIDAMNLPIQLVTYNGIMHRVTREMNDDILNFFKANNQDSCVLIVPHNYPYIEYRYITNAHISKIYFQGDTTIPEMFGAQFAFGIVEYYVNQDYRQLRELQNNAGFNFKIVGNDLEIDISNKNVVGRSSSGDGKFQIFCVKLDEKEYDKLKSGVKYKLIPLNQNKEYTWTVNNDVEFIKPME
jgi:hypothetical protein